MDACEMRRLAEMSVCEAELFRRGYICLAGIDEAGRGPLAGPVVAAVVVFPYGLFIEGVRDSKQLTPLQREKLNKVIQSLAIDYGIGIIHNDVIDRINILQATYLAIKQALMSLKKAPDYLLVDALSIPEVSIPQLGIVHGDSVCYSIAAASILAKVARDRAMLEYHRMFPQYGFDTNKGYGTAKHLERLRRYGPCQIHRRSFRGVKEVC